MTLGKLIADALRSAEYRDLAGVDDGPDPLAELEKELTDAVERVRELRTHAHKWNADDYCSICGRDGRA